MRYIVDHDLHIHSFGSMCSKDPEQTPQRILQYAQETGLTFTQYLTALRIGKAKELLEATEMRSSQIAQEVGYNDSHYFSYLFKKTTGMTPSEYRRANRDET